MRARTEGEGSGGAGFPPSFWSRGGRLWRYGPVVLWLVFIALASTSGFSASNTSRIIRPLLLWLFPGISEPTLDAVHFYVRKAAHFTEYAVLALLAARAFGSSSRAWLRRHWAAFAFALVAVYALSDEFHQSFVSTRTGNIYDSLLDMTGGATALAALWLFGRRRRHDATKPLKNGG